MFLGTPLSEVNPNVSLYHYELLTTLTEEVEC